MTMARLEYSDYYKFFVSIGLTAIGLSVLMPWLFLNESQYLFTAVPTDSVPAELLEINESRHGLLQKVGDLLPIVSLGLFIVGVLFIGFGLRGWKKRQDREEEKEELGLEKLRHEVRSLTESEVEAKAASEAEDEVAEVEQKEAVTGVYGDKNVEQYLEVERKIARKIEQCLGSTYAVLPNQRVGPALLDILVRGDPEEQQDAIVEIKYAQRGFKYGWVSESANRNALAAEIYTRNTGRSAHSVTMFIAPKAALNEKMLPYYQKQFEVEASLIGLSSSISFLEEERIETLSCEKLREWILGPD